MRVHIGKAELSRTFAEAEAQLVQLTGAGHRDRAEFLTILPTHGLRIWSADGHDVGDFGCTTAEQRDAIWSNWLWTYIPLHQTGREGNQP